MPSAIYLPLWTPLRPAAELYSELCNIVERGCRGLPLRGDDGDDGLRLPGVWRSS